MPCGRVVREFLTRHDYFGLIDAPECIQYIRSIHFKTDTFIFDITIITLYKDLAINARNLFSLYLGHVLHHIYVLFCSFFNTAIIPYHIAVIGL